MLEVATQRQICVRPLELSNPHHPTILPSPLARAHRRYLVTVGSRTLHGGDSQLLSRCWKRVWRVRCLTKELILSIWIFWSALRQVKPYSWGCSKQRTSSLRLSSLSFDNIWAPYTACSNSKVGTPKTRARFAHACGVRHDLLGWQWAKSPRAITALLCSDPVDPPSPSTCCGCAQG